MAKVGEGDTRWLVQERADGRNVGNWHWTEKSLFPWAKQQMEETFADYTILEDDTKRVWFAGVDTFKGDMMTMNRKGKTMYIWDINMYLKWKAVIKGTPEPEHEAGGRVDCIDINVTDDDFDTKFTIDTGDNARGRELLAIVKSKAAAIVKAEWKKMTDLMAQLHSNACKAEANSASSGAASPAATSSATSSPMVTPVSSTTPKISSPAPSSAAPSTVSSTTTTSNGDKLSVKTISQVVRFQTKASSIFETLMDTGRVSAFTGSSAQISAEKGSAFKLFGGSVHGTLEDVTTDKLISQKWRFASWPADHYSHVTIEIEDKGPKCLVKLTQTGVPDADFDRTRIGWEEHFWRRIKGVFGWDYKIKK